MSDKTLIILSSTFVTAGLFFAVWLALRTSSIPMQGRGVLLAK
jgi:hypothetical protein